MGENGLGRNRSIGQVTSQGFHRWNDLPSPEMQVVSLVTEFNTQCRLLHFLRFFFGGRCTQLFGDGLTTSFSEEGKSGLTRSAFCSVFPTPVVSVISLLSSVLAKVINAFNDLKSF